MEKLTARKKMRKMLAEPGFIMALGIWDAYTARVAESLGIQCLSLGGYQLGVHYCTSEPLLSLTELCNATRYISNAVNIPVIVDAGAGFGEPLHVMRTVRELERAGAAGLHIEDQIFPKRVHYHKGKEHIIEQDEMVAKIKAAVAARTDPDMLIIARTDAMRTDGYDEGIKRANAYLDAGAEMILIFPSTYEEARRAPKEIKGPVAYTQSEGNMLRRPLFTAKEFEEIGYKLSTYVTALLCPVTQEIKRICTNLLTTGVSGLDNEKMILWRKEVEDLIGLEEYYKIEEETVEK